MRVYHCDQFTFPLPEGHRFPQPKYGMLRRAVEAAGVVPPESMYVPAAATDEQILLAHDLAYLQRVIGGGLAPAEIRRIGLTWSPELVERSRRSVGGTIEASRAALADGIALSLTGGTHHAFRDHGEGYCIFNDVAVAARVMQREGRIERAVVIDCDVHQGNGTASILAGDPTIFTFSIHGAKNFPFRKEPSDLDIDLPDGTGDEAYLEALHGGLERSLSAADADLLYYLAGSDPYEGDSLGRLSLTKAGLAARDELVLSFCRQAGLPVVVVMAGGYARRVEDTIEIQMQTVRAAARHDRAIIFTPERSRG